MAQEPERIQVADGYVIQALRAKLGQSEEENLLLTALVNQQREQLVNQQNQLEAVAKRLAELEPEEESDGEEAAGPQERSKNGRARSSGVVKASEH